MTATANEVIAQRELRNRSAEILRRTSAGESFVITSRGEQMALLTPVDTGAKRHNSRIPIRPAKRTGGWDKITRVKRDVPSQLILDEMRAE